MVVADCADRTGSFTDKGMRTVLQAQKPQEVQA